MEVAKPDPSQPFRRAAQLELIDQQIMDIDQEIAAADHDPQELEQLKSSIDEELSQTFEVQEAAESDYRI